MSPSLPSCFGNLFGPAGILAALLLAAAPARAASTYFDNLFHPEFGFVGLDNSFIIAQSFLTDHSAPAFALNFVVLSLDDSDATDGVFEVKIFNDNGCQPGTLLETLTGNTTPQAAGNYTYASSGQLLSPDTLYWVVATGSNLTGNYAWNYTLFDTTSGPWTTLGWTTSLDGGAHWELIEETAPQLMAISAAAVPEPAAGAGLAGAVVLAAAAYRRRRVERG